jgi:hypothetical protein
MVSKADDPRNNVNYRKTLARKEAGEEGVRLVFAMHEGNRQTAAEAQEKLIEKFGPEKAFKISESVIKAHGGGGMSRVKKLFGR